MNLVNPVFSFVLSSIKSLIARWTVFLVLWTPYSFSGMVNRAIRDVDPVFFFLRRYLFLLCVSIHDRVTDGTMNYAIIMANTLSLVELIFFFFVYKIEIELT